MYGKRFSGFLFAFVQLSSFVVREFRAWENRLPAVAVLIFPLFCSFVLSVRVYVCAFAVVFRVNQGENYGAIDDDDDDEN